MRGVFVERHDLFCFLHTQLETPEPALENEIHLCRIYTISPSSVLIVNRYVYNVELGIVGYETVKAT